MAWVRQRGGKWYVNWRDEHGRKRERVLRHATSKRQAKDRAGELERKAELVRLGLEAPISEEITFGQAVPRYLATLPPEYASRASLTGRLNKRIIPHIGKMSVRRITKADVQTMLAKNGDVAPQTREHLRVATQAVFTFLIGAKLATENPAKLVGKLTIPEREPKYLELAELPLLLDQIPAHWRTAVLLALGTGIRKGEVLGLRKADVLLDDRILVIRQSHQRTTTKSGKERRVPIPLGLTPVLHTQLHAAKGPLLFPNSEGRPWSKTVRLHDIIRRALGRAGLVTGYDVACKSRGARKGCGFVERREAKGSQHCPQCGMALRIYPLPKPIRFKELRSTFATHLTAGTGDIRVVQKILGHSDINVTTRRYAFAMPSHLQAQMDSVSILPARHLPATTDQTSSLQPTPSNKKG